MHENELTLSVELVRDLLREQQPDLLTEPITRVRSHGTVNAMFRVGEGLVCRLPLVAVDADVARAATDAEVAAARAVAPVDVATPELVFLGRPASSYPMPWTVWRWIEGDVATEAIGESKVFATDLARFVQQVRALPTLGRTFTGDGRGGRIADSEEWVAHCLAQSAGMVDVDALRARWNDWRLLDHHASGDTWTHNDLMPGNLLVRDGRLVGVIDVGQAGVADPAVDLQPAWNLLRGDARHMFRAELAPGDEEWERGRAWAFIQAIGCLWYYRNSNPMMSQTARVTLTALLNAS